MHRCHVPDASSPSVILPEDEAHHLTRVLRLGVGAEVVVFDGRGREWSGRVSAAGRSGTTIDLLDERVPLPEPPVRVTLAVALLKGDQMNTVVRDAVMLGASAIAPFVSDHVALPQRAWRDRSSARWERIAVASAKQCGRAIVPPVLGVTTLDDVLSIETGERICCVEPVLMRDATFESGVDGPPPATATICIGPEGGWSPDELACASRHRVHFLTLGPRTLRAETAPTVALSVLWTRWGWGQSRV